VTGVPPSFCTVFASVGVLLVLALERDGEIQHRLLQKAAVGTHLVGGDRLVFGCERGVQDADVAGGGARRRGQHRVRRGARLRHPSTAPDCRSIVRRATLTFRKSKGHGNSP
jgi:hypothetical protein